MKTSQYFIDDMPLQIIILDEDATSGRTFFDRGLGTTWFDYELHMIEQLSDAAILLELESSAPRKLDLLLISGETWSNGGEEFVGHLRAMPAYASLPIYCVVSCGKKTSGPPTQCWSRAWRDLTNCDKDAEMAAIPFTPNFEGRHPSHINGTICANNIQTEISRIVDEMTAYWFQASGG